MLKCICKIRIFMQHFQNICVMFNLYMRYFEKNIWHNKIVSVIFKKIYAILNHTCIFFNMYAIFNKKWYTCIWHVKRCIIQYLDTIYAKLKCICIVKIYMQCFSNIRSIFKLYMEMFFHIHAMLKICIWYFTNYVCFEIIYMHLFYMYAIFI